MPHGGLSFDLVFLDANKDGYNTYYNIIMDHQLLAPGGLLVVDNSLMKVDIESCSTGAPCSLYLPARTPATQNMPVGLPLRPAGSQHLVTDESPFYTGYPSWLCRPRLFMCSDITYPVSLLVRTLQTGRHYCSAYMTCGMLLHTIGGSHRYDRPSTNTNCYEHASRLRNELADVLTFVGMLYCLNRLGCTPLALWQILLLKLCELSTRWWLKTHG